MTDLMTWLSGQGPIFNYRHFKALLMVSVDIIDLTSVCVFSLATALRNMRNPYSDVVVNMATG